MAGLLGLELNHYQREKQFVSHCTIVHFSLLAKQKLTIRVQTSLTSGMLVLHVAVREFWYGIFETNKADVAAGCSRGTKSVR